MAIKRISISVDEDDMNYCENRNINKSKLFRKAVQQHREYK